MDYIEDSITLGEKTYSATQAGFGGLSVLQTTSNPTTSTKGEIGQFCLVNSSGSYSLYICVDNTSNTYTWKKIALS